MADAIPVDQPPALHPATAQILRYFDHAHLPPHLQVVSAPFGELAHYVAETLRLEGAELTAGLRKMLEGKDCVVRAALDVPAEQIMRHAAAGVPHLPLVQHTAHERGTQTFSLSVAMPPDMTPEQLAERVRDELLHDLRNRSGAER